jgi:hypothetical protein
MVQLAKKMKKKQKQKTIYEFFQMYSVAEPSLHCREEKIV